jgi:hypothetical protein
MLPDGDSGFNGYAVGRIDDYGSVLKGRVGFWWSKDIVEDLVQDKAYVFELSEIGVIKLIAQNFRAGNYVRCIKAD